MQDPFEKQADGKSSDGDNHAVDVVRRFMKRSDDYRRPFLKLADNARSLYEVWKDQGKSAIGRANLALPYAYQIVQTELPQLATPFLKEDPPFSLEGRSQQDMQIEDSLTDFIGFQLSNMRFRPKLIAAMEGYCIEGTVIYKVPYRYEEMTIINRRPGVDPLTGEVVMMPKAETETKYDGPDLESVPLWDFFPDWAMRTPGDVQNMRGCCHRVFKTIAELKLKAKKTTDGQSQGTYKNTDELEQSIGTKGVDAWSEPYYKNDASRVSDTDQLRKKPIEVWEYWGLYDKNQDGKFEEYVITIANGDVVLRCEPNPYKYKFKPFIACPNVMMKDEFYGLSELFAVRSGIREATALRNARLDNVNLAVNRMWKVDRAAGINVKALYSRPNGIVLTNDMRGLEPIPPPEVPASSFRELQELGSEIQQSAASLSGPDLSQAGKTFGRSATGASLVSGIATSRSSIKLVIISELLLKPLCDIMMWTNAQYVTDDQWVRVTDSQAPNPFTQLPTSAFHCNYDFVPSTTIDSNKDEQMAKLQMGMQYLQAAEQTQPGIINWETFFGEVGREIFGREYKKFVRSDQERQMLQYQQMQMQAAANAQAGQAAPQGAGGASGTAQQQQGQRAPQPQASQGGMGVPR